MTVPVSNTLESKQGQLPSHQQPEREKKTHGANLVSNVTSLRSSSLAALKSKNIRKSDIELARKKEKSHFLLLGLSAVLIYFAVTKVLFHFAGFSALQANVTAYLSFIFFSYLAHGVWQLNNKDRLENYIKLFFVVLVSGVSLVLVFGYLLSTGTLGTSGTCLVHMTMLGQCLFLFTEGGGTLVIAFLMLITTVSVEKLWPNTKMYYPHQ